MMDNIEFIECLHYARAMPRLHVDFVVIHCEQTPERPQEARNVALWMAGKTADPAPMTSCHYFVDDVEVVQGVKEIDRAWHCGATGNERGIGIEHTGYAAWDKMQWDDDYCKKMLARSAELCAHICANWDIPIMLLDDQALRRGLRGITTHDYVRRAWKETTHTDPGDGFDVAGYLVQVRDHANALRALV